MHSSICFTWYPMGAWWFWDDLGLFGQHCPYLLPKESTEKMCFVH